MIHNNLKKKTKNVINKVDFYKTFVIYHISFETVGRETTVLRTVLHFNTWTSAGLRAVMIICSAADHQVSQQPQPPWGFYTEWQCRIKYSLSPASVSVSGREMSSSRQHCLSPSGLFIHVHQIKQQSTKASLQERKSAPWSVHKGWYE